MPLAYNAPWRFTKAYLSFFESLEYFLFLNLKVWNISYSQSDHLSFFLEFIPLWNLKAEKPNLEFTLNVILSNVFSNLFFQVNQSVIADRKRWKFLPSHRPCQLFSFQSFFVFFLIPFKDSYNKSFFSSSKTPLQFFFSRSIK